MAKIALISEQITPSLIQWAEGLEQQRHQVRIITSRSSHYNKKTTIPIQFYFQKWSLLETLRLIPSLTHDLPEIFHFVFQDETETAKAAHWSLLSFANSLRRSVISSLMARPGQHWKWNPFLRWSDGVSFETKESLLTAKRTGLVHRHQKTEILLPIVPASHDSLNSQLHQLQISLGNYFVIAGAPHRQILDLLDSSLAGSEIHPVFWGPRSRQSHTLPYTALFEGGSTQLEGLIAGSQGLILCLHDFSTSELLRWKSLSLHHQIPLWIRIDQLEAVPGLCREGKTGFVVNLNPVDLRKSFQQSKSSYDFGTQGSQTFPLEMADQTLNLLSRFYSEIQNT